VAKKWLSGNSLRANEVGLSATPDTFSRWTHRHPQRLKPGIVGRFNGRAKARPLQRAKARPLQRAKARPLQRAKARPLQRAEARPLQNLPPVYCSDGRTGWEKTRSLKGTAFRPYVTNLKSVRL